MKKNYITSINENIKTHKKLAVLENKINQSIDKIYNTIKSGGKVFTCGNGGSAADAQHLAAEFLVRLRPNKNRRAYPMISLALDTSTLTACGNDIGFDNIFSRNLSALGDKKDLLIAISTSGNSKNIINALKEANKMKIFSIAFLGSKGGNAKKYTDLKLIVPSNSVARIQEAHIFLGHYILEKVEDKILNAK